MRSVMFYLQKKNGRSGRSPAGVAAAVGVVPAADSRLHGLSRGARLNPVTATVTVITVPGEPGSIRRRQPPGPRGTAALPVARFQVTSQVYETRNRDCHNHDRRDSDIHDFKAQVVFKLPPPRPGA